MTNDHETLSLSDRLDANQTLRDAGLFLVRAMLAAVFVFHGGQKLFGWFGGYGVEGTAGFFASVGIPLPYLSVLAAGGAEFFGGILLLLGLFVRPAAAVMSVTMLVATVVVHLPHGFDARGNGAEYPMTLAAVLAGLALLGGGRWAVGQLFRAGRGLQPVPALAH